MKRNRIFFSCFSLFSLLLIGCTSCNNSSKGNSPEIDHSEEEYAKKYATKPFLSEDGKTITYGLFPQTNVNDPTILEALGKLKTPEANGWYLYKGDYYAKQMAAPYHNDYSFDNGTAIVGYTTYWFKCEPIVWNILNANSDKYYIVSSVLLENRPYSYIKSTIEIDGETVYPPNYKHSYIREWLNGDFYNLAFGLGNAHIQVTTVDNSAATTESLENPYACENTEDKIFLPSYQDYLNSSYGFSELKDSSDTRYCKTTDWARARGSFSLQNGGSDKFNGDYWTRSPSGKVTNDVWHIFYDGSPIFYYGGNHLDNRGVSVRPGLVVTLA